MNLTLPYNEEKIRDIIAVLLHERPNTTITIIRDAQKINVVEGDVEKEKGSFGERVVSLEQSLYNAQKGVLYKSILEAVEKPLIEDVLKRTHGNQLKAARVLGLNRNTIRTKIKKLGIDARMFKDGGEW
jgi:two-component system, NtrC family, nitrogen regulation response regulator GlnG